MDVYRQLFADIKMLKNKAFANKTGINRIIFHFNIHGKLSVIRSYT